MARKIFTSSNGKQMAVIGLSRAVIDGILTSAEYPKKPTYTIVTASGVEEVQEHDEKSLVTEEDKAAWEKYKADYAAVDKAVFRHTLDAFLLVGCEVDMSGMEKWKELQKFLGIKLPENEFELQRNYIEATYLPTEDDIVELTTLIMSSSGVDREDVEKAKKSFRDKVEKPKAIRSAKKNGRGLANKRNIQPRGNSL